MRRLSEREKDLINSDLSKFESLFKMSGLINDKFLSKYSGITITAEDDAVLKGALGQIFNDGDKRCIRLQESVINNPNQRTGALYHELGHYLLGLKDNDEKARNSVLKSIVNTRRDNTDKLTYDSEVYLEGIFALEEYLVEKFVTFMLYRAQGMPEPSKKAFKNSRICGDYIYYTTFDSNYGIIEGLGDKIVNRIFGNSTNAIKAGLSEEFYTGFLKNMIMLS